MLKRLKLLKSIQQFLINMYKHTSNFIHSDPISLAQLHAATTQTEIDILLDVPKKYIIMFLALSLDILMKLSPVINKKVVDNMEINKKLILYKSLSKLKFEGA